MFQFNPPKYLIHLQNFHLNENIYMEIDHNWLSDIRDIFFESVKGRTMSTTDRRWAIAIPILHLSLRLRLAKFVDAGNGTCWCKNSTTRGYEDKAGNHVSHCAVDNEFWNAVYSFLCLSLIVCFVCLI